MLYNILFVDEYMTFVILLSDLIILYLFHHLRDKRQRWGATYNGKVVREIECYLPGCDSVGFPRFFIESIFRFTVKKPTHYV
jgi:hypothetical protein